MKRLILLTVVMTLLWSVVPADGGIQDVHIEPNHPTNTDLITIVASAQWGGCGVGIEASDFRVEGDSLELDIFCWVGHYGGICPWSHSEVIGTLPAGSYNLRVYAYIHNPGQPYSLGDTYSISFTVLPTNSNSIVKDGIEYYVQTDKAVYVLGEEVEMLYRVTNLRDEEVIFYPLPSPEWNFWAERDGNDIWRAINGWWGIIVKLTLEPGESKVFPEYDPFMIWDMRDRDGNLVSPGQYTVIGGLYTGSGEYDFTKVGVGITIIPEPPDVVELPLACEGDYVHLDTWTTDFDLGVTFSEITNVYIDWCGAITAEVAYWSNEPNDTFPVDAKFAAALYKSGEFAGGTHVQAGEDAYPVPEAFDLQSAFLPFGQNWNMFLDGQGTVKVAFYMLPHYGNLFTLVDPNGRINCATLVFKGTIVPEPHIGVDVEIQPDTLNLASKGKWISCHIRLPEDYNVADVNSATVFLEDDIPAERIWFNEKQNVVMAKFSLKDVEEIIQPGLVELTVTGQLLNGTLFEGRDTIRVLNKGKTSQLTRKRHRK